MTANLILQEYLDRVAKAVMTDDWDSYHPCVAIPCHLVTHTSTVTIADVDRLRDGFTEFRDTLRLQRVTDYIRLVQSAAFLDDDLLSGRYVSHLLVGGQRLLDPFQSEITLRRIDGLWKAVSISNAIANSRWARLMPVQAYQSPEEGTKT